MILCEIYFHWNLYLHECSMLPSKAPIANHIILDQIRQLGNTATNNDNKQYMVPSKECSIPYIWQDLKFSVPLAMNKNENVYMSYLFLCLLSILHACMATYCKCVSMPIFWVSTCLPMYIYYKRLFQGNTSFKSCSFPFLTQCEGVCLRTVLCR